jgi:hypothetical protein
MAQTTVTLRLDQVTGHVSIQADNLPDGEASYFQLMRILAAAMNVTCDQLEDKRLVVAKAFKPFFRA